jgi:hypothetical protein
VKRKPRLAIVSRLEESSDLVEQAGERAVREDALARDVAQDLLVERLAVGERGFRVRLRGFPMQASRRWR